MPAPAFVRAVEVAVLVIEPLMVLVTAGLSTVMVRPASPRAIAPESVTPLPEMRPPNVKSPLTVTALPTVRAVPSLRSEVPPAMVRVPVPTGPLVTAGGVPVLFTPNMSPPSFRLKPVVKVLAPPRASTPAPALTRGPVMPAFGVMGALMTSSVSARPLLTWMTGLALLNWSAVKAAEPVLMVGVVERLSLVAVIGVGPVMTSVWLLPAVGVPSATVGLPVPPALLKVTLARLVVTTLA